LNPEDDRWRQFFCDREAASRACAGLELRAPVLHIWHQDLECSYAHPDWSRPEDVSFYRYPWARRAGPAQRTREDGGARTPQFMTDLRELDVVQGGEKKLRAALDAGLAHDGELSALVVNSGCVPAAIGDDVPRIMRAASNPRGVPLIYNDCAGGRDADVGRILFDKIRAEPGRARPKKIPRSVNLVGFPKGAALGELVALLERSGLTVNACVMPAMTPDQARGLDAAQAQVFMPNAAYAKVYKEVFSALPVPGHTFEPPYGMEGTRLWLRSVAGLFKREAAAEKAFAAEFSPWSGHWDALRRRALELKFAFVVDRAQLPRLKDASLMWGVPVLGLLREMGVRAEVLLYNGTDRGPVKGFKDKEELERRLRDGAYDAVYSEYFFDDRLVRAGAVPFSLAPFEPGVRGAAATLERLLALGRWGFYRRYAPYLQGPRP
jgi:hypothetical protein